MPIKSKAGLDSFLRSEATKCVEHYVTTDVVTSRFIQFLCEPISELSSADSI